jgi:hypothetical protein
LPIFLFIAGLALMLVMGLLLAALRRLIGRADDKTRLQAWQLRQLVSNEES